MRYAWITSQEGTFSIKAMCRVLKVRRNGDYAWKGRKPGSREAQAKRLDETLVSGLKRTKDARVHPETAAFDA